MFSGAFRVAFAWRLWFAPSSLIISEEKEDEIGCKVVNKGGISNFWSHGKQKMMCLRNNPSSWGASWSYRYYLPYGMVEELFCRMHFMEWDKYIGDRIIKWWCIGDHLHWTMPKSCVITDTFVVCPSMVEWMWKDNTHLIDHQKPLGSTPREKTYSCPMGRWVTLFLNCK